jgi:hypothetical protein
LAKQRGRKTHFPFHLPSAIINHKPGSFISANLSQATLSLFVCALPYLPYPQHNTSQQPTFLKQQAAMDSSHSQSFRASSSDSLGEEKKCNEDAYDDVDPTVPDSAFDDILTTVRKEEWYRVSLLWLHLI